MCTLMGETINIYVLIGNHQHLYSYGKPRFLHNDQHLYSHWKASAFVLSWKTISLCPVKGNHVSTGNATQGILVQ